MTESRTNRHDTVVIGGSQSGLTAGWLLKKAGRDFVILDAEKRIGDAWRRRWDSLRLFTPNMYNALPGLRFPGPKYTKPTKDEMADYLESYAEHHRLPVRPEARVERLRRRADGLFEVTAAGEQYIADNVVVATGACQDPKIPSFADDLDPSIVQLHSSQYKGPHQLANGPVLIVGLGNSGADISLDVAPLHETTLAGKPSAVVPFRVDSFKARYLVRVVRFMGHRVLSLGSPVGRKVLPKMAAKAAPLVRVKPKDIVAAGVRRIERVTGALGGLPVDEAGEQIKAANVIWCTGFMPRWDWIDLPSIPESGEPPHRRGVVESEPGLYFLGLLKQYAATSETITGMPRDAAYIIKHLTGRSKRRPLVGAAG